jgi:hypothetical protein
MNPDRFISDDNGSPIGCNTAVGRFAAAITISRQQWKNKAGTCHAKYVS